MQAKAKRPRFARPEAGVPMTALVSLLKADGAQLSPIFCSGDGGDWAEDELPPRDKLLACRSSSTVETQPKEFEAEHNRTVLSAQDLGGSRNIMPTHPKYSEPHLAAPFQVEGELAHEAYCNVVEALNVDFSGSKSHLLFAKQQYKGGWKNGGYPDISSDKGFDPTVQTRCVFPIGGGKPGTKAVPEACKHAFYAAPGLDALYHAVLDTLCEEWKKETDEFCLGQFHILFGYSQMAHFAYHRDSNTFDKWSPEITALVQLSRGKSSMHVANATCPVQYSRAGSGVFFDCDLYHRGAEQEHGTVKVAFFFVLRRPKVKKEGEAGSSSKDKMEEEEEEEEEEDEDEEDE